MASPARAHSCPGGAAPGVGTEAAGRGYFGRFRKPLTRTFVCGDDRTRTDDPLLAKQNSRFHRPGTLHVVAGQRPFLFHAVAHCSALLGDAVWTLCGLSTNPRLVFHTPLGALGRNRHRPKGRRLGAAGHGRAAIVALRLNASVGHGHLLGSWRPISDMPLGDLAIRRDLRRSSSTPSKPAIG